MVPRGIELIVADLAADEKLGKKRVLLKPRTQILIDLGNLINLHDVPSRSELQFP